jgi:RNA polymerase sigma-70 factor (ECF subfamily)
LLDQEIIALFFARDERAIEETGRKYGAYCYTVAHRILSAHEDAEECVNDTYLRTWNTIPPQKPDIFKLFLAKITRNLAINRYEMLHTKKRGSGETAAVLEELEECVAGGASPEQEVIAGELGACIDRFVRELPERDGNIFIRRYFYTESVEEIAGRYGLAAGNVSVILHRVRTKLRKYLAKEGYLV